MLTHVVKILINNRCIAVKLSYQILDLCLTISRLAEDLALS